VRKTFLEQLELGKKQLEGNRDEYDEILKHLRSELAVSEKEVNGLVSTLANAAGTPSEGYIMKQIEEHHKKIEAFKSRIGELEGVPHALSDIEFDLLRQLLSNFSTTLDHMEIEQKRAALRSLIKKIVWDGTNIHVYLFGSEDKGDIELPPIPSNERGQGDASPCGGSGGNAPAVLSSDDTTIPFGKNSK
jgi:DNA repair exonuclease SbcCD ATPase subunit